VADLYILYKVSNIGRKGIDAHCPSWYYD